MAVPMNFGLKTQQSVSTRKPILKPYGIYKVKLDSIKGETFAGKKDPSKEYHVLKVTFSNKEGVYTETIFYPETEKDMERMKFDNTDRDGKSYTSYMPSTYDRAMAFVAQVADVIDHDNWEKMQKKSDKYTCFADIVKDLEKIGLKNVGKETNLKLVGRVKSGVMEAVLPNFVKINRDGESYIADNFIGDLLSFTPAEEAKRKAYLNSSPTEMEDSTDDITSDETTETIDVEEEEDDIDVDDLDI